MEDNIIFDGVTLADVFRDIYNNATIKRTEIKRFIDKLAPLVTTVDDAVQVAPVIKEFMEVSVKNDEQLIKLSQIVQRIVTAQTKSVGDDGFLTDNEKLNLIANVQTQLSEMSKASDELEDVVNNIAETV